VLEQLAGAARTSWFRVEGVDLAVAANRTRGDPPGLTSAAVAWIPYDGLVSPARLPDWSRRDRSRRR
jgi:hypothetical protein